MKKKLSLDELKVESFKTDERINQVKGGAEDTDFRSFLGFCLYTPTAHCNSHTSMGDTNCKSGWTLCNTPCDGTYIPNDI